MIVLIHIIIVVTIPTSITVDMSPDRLDGRQWIIPKVSDYNASSRLISTSKSVPSYFSFLSRHYTAAGNNISSFIIAHKPLYIELDK